MINNNLIDKKINQLTVTVLAKFLGLSGLRPKTLQIS